MMKRTQKIFGSLFVMAAGLGATNTAWAQAVEASEKVLEGGAMFFSVCAASAAFCIALAAIGTGMAQGRALDRALESIARQPEVAKEIRVNMIIGLGFIESLCIYALLISFFLLILNPFTSYFVG